MFLLSGGRDGIDAEDGAEDAFIDKNQPCFSAPVSVPVFLEAQALGSVVLAGVMRIAALASLWGISRTRESR